VDTELEDDGWAPAQRLDLSVLELDGELVIFDPLTTEVHQLNAIGTVIWSLLDGRATVDVLVQELAEGFNVPPDRVRQDVTGLLEELAEHKLLAHTPPMAPESGSRGAVPEPRYLVDPPAP
jgi:PqqD family protein of HPr-rel-A system